MNGPSPNLGSTKKEALADAINRLLYNLVVRCARDEGVRHYFDVGIIAYSDGFPGAFVGPALEGTLAGRDLVPIGEVADNPVRVDDRTRTVSDGAGGTYQESFKMPIWFDAVGNGNTPMIAALRYAYGVADRYLASHPNCFPPTVFNITDGEATDGSPEEVLEAMRTLTGLASSDGNVLLYNLHLSSNGLAFPVAFPNSDEALPDKYARALFNGASELYPDFRSTLEKEGMHILEGARGFVLNGDMVTVIKVMDVGTRVAAPIEAPL